jgi:hypothetical protein
MNQMLIITTRLAYTNNAPQMKQHWTLDVQESRSIHNMTNRIAHHKSPTTIMALMTVF